jgi:hypothetical protein
MGVEDSKPTPTQAENDQAAQGAHVINKEDDGSGAEPPTPDAGGPYPPAQASSKPTPTQAENDSAAKGESVMDKEHDGSTEPAAQQQAPKKKPTQSAPQAMRSMEAQRPAGGYQTRQARPATPPEPKSE